jgi:hypothetical protein
MHLQTTQNQRSRFTGNDVGKIISVSFGFHELHLIEDLDRLAHFECVNRSQWIRRRIREEKQRLKEQESHFDRSQLSWNHLVGQT